MRCFTTVMFVLAVGTSFVGCGFENAASSTPGTVAVIDLDRIASQLGSEKVIADSLSRQQTSLNQQLVQMARNYQAQISERRQAMSETPEPQQNVQLAAWHKEADAQLNKAKQQAQQDLARYRAQLIQEFRDKIRPLARQVANERGLSIIVTRNDSVVYDYGASVDITDEVLQRLASTMPAQQQSTSVATQPAGAEQSQVR